MLDVLSSGLVSALILDEGFVRYLAERHCTFLAVGQAFQINDYVYGYNRRMQAALAEDMDRCGYTCRVLAAHQNADCVGITLVSMFSLMLPALLVVLGTSCWCQKRPITRSILYCLIVCNILSAR